ncbi:hypothetical protein ACHAWF_010590 [Thalassiosira exigua]
MKILDAHFNRVFNNHKSVRFEILDTLDDCDTMFGEDRDISYAEFEQALNGLANDKAPGENGVSPNLLKALDDENRKVIYGFIVDFWEGETDYESWHSGLLCIIPKPGKDKTDPNNCRGINLMDVVSKILSRILFKILEKNGTKFQFGGTPSVGCREGVFTLKTLLHLRRNHGLSTHVAFIDLVKAYDTADHKLLIKVLKKFGAPPKLCSIVERLYTDLKVVFKMGALRTEIKQGVGVRQGEIWPMFCVSLS